MMTRTTGLTGIVLALMLQATPAQDSSARSDRDFRMPQLWLAIRAISPDGPWGAEARTRWNLEFGHRAQLRVSAGSAEFPDLCAIGSSDKVVPGSLVEWVLEAELLEVTNRSARVALSWSRTMMRPGVIAEGDLRRTYEARLGDGADSVIDLVRRSTPIPGCDGVVVRMGFDFADPPQLASEVLDYEIWLVHREANGNEVVDRSAGRGLQGELVRYLFRPFHYAEDGSSNPSGPVTMEFGGWVRGRVRPDGRIGLSLQAQRTVTKNRLGDGKQGDKDAVLDDGETLEVELPPYEWGSGALQRTSVRVTVRRIR